MTNEKKCPSCKKILPISAFGIVKTRPDGLSAYCKPCRKKKQHESHAANPHKRRANARNYYYQHPEKMRASVTKNRQNLRMAALIYYGGERPFCACCGDQHIEFLSIDHIDNNGAAHRKELSYGKKSKGTSVQVNRWLRDNNYPSGFQVLCHNCNFAKHVYKICPHQLK